MRYTLLTILFSFVILTNVSAQATTYYDPAEAVLRILMHKNQTKDRQLIGSFKVLGTSYLYGGNQIGDVYFKNKTVKNVLVTYDTYRQLLEINIGKGDASLKSTLPELDSFRIRNITPEIREELTFISVTQLDSTKKIFLQRVVTGPRFNLYKAYTSDLDYVSENYIQSELREFKLNYVYYYTDKLNPGLRKLKNSSAGIIKEFKPIKDISRIVDKDSYNNNPETTLINVFAELNQLSLN